MTCKTHREARWSGRGWMGEAKGIGVVGVSYKLIVTKRKFCVVER